MVTQESSAPRVWTIAETKARLSEILRLAEQEGPQRVGTRNPFVIVPERLWRERAHPASATLSPMPMGQWLVANFPRVGELEVPTRRSDREPPFAKKIEESAGEAGA